ncbi:hypothetical protein B9Z55_024927 [Caenorhabditis nigoni]|uniref:Chitin-binding type-2 domain-containing protein n=1 Tax=Caenorhabditis nigoni TaxID=1611254 RepID=A0A2G5SWN3_9PELO|nr:hypothetical protein B9Z55_024927 [Caenorhabditis nigoni]
MRQLSLLVATAILLTPLEGRNTVTLKGPPCPDGDGLYAIGCSSKYLQCVNNVEYEQTCPEGLYFDRLMARCERRSANHLCNDANRRTLNVRQKAVAVNCVGRLNGDYPMDKNVCNENYYQCANGIFYMRKCPHNQVYSPVLKRCDYASNCKATDGVKQYAAAAYASPTYEADNWVVTTKEFDNGHKGIDCAVLGDLYFTNENQCSPYFWQCSNGKLFRKSCPEGLIYVLSQNLCDYPQGVKGCPEYDGSETSYEQPATTTTTAAPYVPTRPARPSYETPVDPAPYVPAPAPYVPAPAPPRPTRPAPPKTTQAPHYTFAAPPATPPTAAPYVPAEAPTAPVTSSPIIVYNPAVHGDCNKDGFFAIKQCHQKFLSCSGGVGRVIICPGNSVYDPRTTKCDHADICLSPIKPTEPVDMYNHGGANNDKPAEIKVDFDCTGKVNGVHVKESCTHQFYRCENGRAFAETCPADLVYNKATATCDYADNCDRNYIEPSHNYEQTTTPAPTVRYEAPVVYTTQKPVYTQPPRDTERPTTIYARPIYTKAPTTVGYEAPTTTAAPYTTQAPVTIPTVADDFSCANLIDGNHASGLCKNVFYTCANNQITATRCPGNLVFNPYLGQCDYEQNVRDCQGYQPPETTTGAYVYMESSTSHYSPYSTTQRPTTPAYVPTTTQGYAPTQAVTTPGYAPSYAPTTQRPAYSAFCEMLADGNYGKKCEQYFFQCYLTETYRKECPAGLWYSIENDRCDFKENVQGCPEYKPTPTTTPAAEQPQPPKYGYIPNKYPNIDYTTTTPGPVDTTTIAEAFSCYGRPDGIYALPYCSQDFVQCIHGRSLVIPCATGLFYSEKTGLCDYKENVETCTIKKGSDSISTNACSGKSDGYYSAGCSSHYFSCIDEQIRKMTCPNKLKFSEKKSTCTYASDIDECSISAKPDRAPPAVPSDFCTIRQNGLHAFQTCSPHYVVCDNNRAIAGTCAAPLVFNGQNQHCDYKSNNQECGSAYIPPVTTTTPAADEPSYTTTATPYQPQKTTSSEQYYRASTTRAYQQPTTTTKAYEAPATTTRAPTTTTKAYEAPTTTTRAYEAPTTTTPSRDVEVPTTTVSYTQETTTTPAQEATTTTTASYVPPTTTASYAAY